MYVPDLQIGTILLIPIIAVIIEVLKQVVKMPSSWAPWVNAVLTLLGFALVEFNAAYPQFEPTIITILTMVMVFLGATGFYEFTSRTVTAAAVLANKLKNSE